MQLLLVGVSHRTAPVELRERLDFSARGVDRALDRAGRTAGARRSRDRLDLQPRRALRRLRRTRNGARGHPAVSLRFPRHLRPISWRRTSTRRPGRTPCTHLFRVAAGPRLARHGRAAGARPGEGRLQPGVADGLHRPAAEQAVPFGVCRRQARARRNRAGGRRGLGQLRRGRAGAKDLRQSARAHGARARRGRDGQAHGDPHAVAGHRPAHHHEPHRRARRGARADDRRHGHAVGIADRGACRGRHPDYRDRRERRRSSRAR